VILPLFVDVDDARMIDEFFLLMIGRVIEPRWMIAGLAVMILMLREDKNCCRITPLISGPFSIEHGIFETN
jgi:hypothetical protein